MQKISAVIITKNNESIIKDCLQSLLWTDEIVVVDSGSTDNTLAICKSFDCKIISSPWLGFGKTKQLAVNSTSNNWVFSLDSDEICSAALSEKIQQILSSKSPKVGYKIKRCTFFMGKAIKYSGWQKDYPLRLFQKQAGNFNDFDLHEFVEIKGETDRIKELIWHHSFPSISSYLNKIESYTTLGAKIAFKKGKKGSPLLALIKGLFKFFKMYILKRGFLDGMAGLMLAAFSGFGAAIKIIKLHELNQSS
jgi:glycosyltransferase involved in cell wall biosynthesis